MSKTWKGFLTCFVAWAVLASLLGLYEFGPLNPLATKKLDWDRVGEWGLTVTVRAIIGKDLPSELSFTSKVGKSSFVLMRVLQIPSLLFLGNLLSAPSSDAVGRITKSINDAQIYKTLSKD